MNFKNDKQQRASKTGCCLVQHLGLIVIRHVVRVVEEVEDSVVVSGGLEDLEDAVVHHQQQISPVHILNTNQ
ncbi:hypothetical protein L3X38_008255 [Prunus dulcis]|uniref:Uncharacterized protein n=1 Tax=Prunus dulcis TaxID=3755 RepID=A0AAD4ZW29_PRUDU|nr:hypothetical protein L3X38_008255 [Prunus dulcis]